jgi:DNA polymerase V
LIKSKLGVTGERSQLEINGTPCVEMDFRVEKKSIMSSRSFGKAVTKITDLEEAVATYISRAAEKLRKQKSLASHISIYLRTNYHKEQEEQYANYALGTFDTPTDNSIDLIKLSINLLNGIFKEGIRYKKAGVVLTGLIPKDSTLQLDIFDRVKVINPKYTELMKAMDGVNQTWGDDTLKVAALGIKQDWKGRKNKISQRYTTKWDELLNIKI